MRLPKALQGEARSLWDIIQQKVSSRPNDEQMQIFISLYKFLGLKFQQILTSDLITERYNS